MKKQTLRGSSYHVAQTEVVIQTPSILGQEVKGEVHKNILCLAFGHSMCEGRETKSTSQNP